MDWRLIAALVGALGGLLGVLLKSALDRQTRADLFAAKLFEAKIRGYEALQVSLDRAASAAKLGALEKNPELLHRMADALGDLYRSEVPFSHLFPISVLGALEKFIDFGWAMYRKKPEDLGPADLEEVLRLANDLHRAIRADCGADIVSRHVNEILFPAPNFIAREWERTRAEAPPALMPPDRSTAEVKSNKG